MRFKMDENLHPDAGGLLLEAGHDVATVTEQDLRGHPDGEVARVCRDEGRVLITLDKGFGDITTYPPSQYQGMIVCRLLDQSRSNVVAVITRLIPWIDTHPLAGKLWIVDEREIRIRGSDE